MRAGKSSFAGPRRTSMLSDVHIRKAFAYCFDWDTVINDVYRGEAVQSMTLSLPGMPGYSADSAHYYLDLDKCAEEFKLADVDKDGVAAGEDPDRSEERRVG